MDMNTILLIGLAIMLLFCCGRFGRFVSRRIGFQSRSDVPASSACEMVRDHVSPREKKSRKAGCCG